MSKTSTVAPEAAIPDLYALRFLDSSTLHLKHPDKRVKAPLGVSIELAGPGHPQTVAHAEMAHRRQIEELTDFQRRAREAIEAGQEVPLPPDQARTRAETIARNAEELAARVIRADPFRWENGEVIHLTAANAAAYFKREDLGWLFGQANQHVQNTANFLPASV